MKKLFSIKLVLMMILGLVGCGKSDNEASNREKTAEYHKISPEEAKKMLDENSDIILLDVRTANEYKEIHIPNAILIPDFEIKEKAETELTDKDAVILVYCRSGVRSKGALNQLVSMGYTNVYDFGGIGSWKYDTVSE